MKYILLIFVFAMVPFPVFAHISITEIYPAPENGDYEWIELHNSSKSEIHLGGYRLYDKSNNQIDISTANVKPDGYYLASTSSILNNSGDTIRIENDTGKVLETVTYPGNITSGETYARCTDTDKWAVITRTSPGKANELICQTKPTVTPSPIEKKSSPPPPTITKQIPTSIPNQVPQGLQINEVYPHPETDQEEWVELYNGSSQTVVLDNWYIDDVKDGGSQPISFTVQIEPGEYSVQRFSIAIFNNSSDSVRLLDPNKTEVDILSYENSTLNRSFGRDQNMKVCLMEPTPNKKNMICDKAEQKNQNEVSSQPDESKMNNDVLYKHGVSEKQKGMGGSISNSSVADYPVWLESQASKLDSPKEPSPTGRIIQKTQVPSSQLIVLRILSSGLTIYVISSIGYKVWHQVSKRSLHLTKHQLY